MEIDRTILFDADAFYRGGRLPWSFLAYPTAIADSDGLPVDKEALGFLVAMQRRGVPLGTWTLPPDAAHSHTWAVVRREDSSSVFAAMKALEAEGTIGKGYINRLTERLMSLG